MTAHDEIVAVQIGTVLYRDLRTISRYALLRDTDQPCQLISRAHMQLMAAFDPKWQEFANASTLFVRKDNGEFTWPEVH